MFFDDELTTNNDDFSICLGVEDFLCGRDFGRDRGEKPFLIMALFSIRETSRTFRIAKKSSRKISRQIILKTTKEFKVR
jgi:hypothetical protein